MRLLGYNACKVELNRQVVDTEHTALQSTLAGKLLQHVNVQVVGTFTPFYVCQMSLWILNLGVR